MDAYEFVRHWVCALRAAGETEIRIGHPDGRRRLAAVYTHLDKLLGERGLRSSAEEYHLVRCRNAFSPGNMGCYEELYRYLAELFISITAPGHEDGVIALDLLQVYAQSLLDHVPPQPRALVIAAAERYRAAA